jgi:hypothetical protein
MLSGYPNETTESAAFRFDFTVAVDVKIKKQVLNGN